MFTAQRDYNKSEYKRCRRSTTEQNSYSISHLLGTVTTPSLDSDGVVTVVNCQQHSDYGDYTAIGSLVTVLPADVNGDYTVIVQSL